MASAPLLAVLATRALEASKAAQALERRPPPTYDTPAPRLGERALHRVRRRRLSAPPTAARTP